MLQWNRHFINYYLTLCVTYIILISRHINLCYLALCIFNEWNMMGFIMNYFCVSMVLLNVSMRPRSQLYCRILILKEKHETI